MVKMRDNVGQQYFQLSLKETLFIIGFIAVAIASLASHKQMASPTIAVIFIAFVAMVIRAAVAGQRDRTFAIGFVIAFCLYLASTVYFGDHEYSQSQGKMPTSRFLQSLVQPPYGIRGDIIVKRADAARSLMPLGHLLIATACGYCGGKYAVWVYVRTRQQLPNTTN